MQSGPDRRSAGPREAQDERFGLAFRAGAVAAAFLAVAVFLLLSEHRAHLLGTAPLLLLLLACPLLHLLLHGGHGGDHGERGRDTGTGPGSRPGDV